MLVTQLTRLQTRATAPDAASALLNGFDLIAFGARLRLVEVETYLHRPDDADPFVHRDPRQAVFATWYLHRTGGTLKNGTFKGLDLTYGDPSGPVFGGLLLRAVATADGRIVDGPCKVVDHLMACAGVEHVAHLDAIIQDGLTLEAVDPPRDQGVLRTARVGLGGRPEYGAWRTRRERFLTEPRGVKKGRREVIDALLADGLSVDAIHALTGSPRKTIAARRG